MEVEFKNTPPNFIEFKDLKPGDLFKDDICFGNTGFILMKVKNNAGMNVVCVTNGDKFSYHDDHEVEKLHGRLTVV